jgi:hypothetical protein
MGDGAPSFMVRATAGSLRLEDGVRIPHSWTPDGVLADAAGTGGHFFHLAVALCVLNDTYREAQRLGLTIDGVEVKADGEFDDAWASTGMTYQVEIASQAAPEALGELLRVVDDVAEIPRAIRAGAPVRRIEVARS